MMISGIGSGEFPDYIDVLKVPFVSVSTSSGRCDATRVSAGGRSEKLGGAGEGDS